MGATRYRCSRATAHAVCSIGDIYIERNREAMKDLNKLSRRETQVIDLLSTGLTNKQIGYKLNITEGTVKVYLKNIYAKTDIHGRVKLAMYWTALRSLRDGTDPYWNRDAVTDPNRSKKL